MARLAELVVPAATLEQVKEHVEVSRSASLPFPGSKEAPGNLKSQDTMLLEVSLESAVRTDRLLAGHEVQPNATSDEATPPYEKGIGDDEHHLLQFWKDGNTAGTRLVRKKDVAEEDVDDDDDDDDGDGDKGLENVREKDGVIIAATDDVLAVANSQQSLSLIPSRSGPSDGATSSSAGLASRKAQFVSKGAAGAASAGNK